MIDELLYDMCVQLDVKIIDKFKKVISTEDSGYFYELIRCAVTVEKRLSPKCQRCQHSSKTPHVYTVVVIAKVKQQFWGFED